MERVFQGGRYLLPGLVIILAVILADQYTKWLVIDTMHAASGAHPGFFTWLITPNHEYVMLRDQFSDQVLLPVLNLVLVWNHGISFGMMGESAHMAMFFIALSLMIALLLLLWLAMSQQKIIAAALALIIGGALGNVADRLRFDAVADFIDFHLGNHHWPAFNVADSCIVIGACILMLLSLLHKEDTQREDTKRTT
jgi:signal peptidase II